ncbi:MAG: hypothetical protein AB8F78_01950 [Saprospiraceae bacterium]
MKILNRIENVAHYEVYNSSVLIGRDTRIVSGIISHGNQILRITNGKIEILREGAYFYFTAFKDGFLHYDKEGDPIHFSNSNGSIVLTPENHYFSPLHNLPVKDEIVITKMDKDFVQKHYFLNSMKFSNKQESAFYPHLNNSQHYCDFNKRESWIEIMNKQSQDSYRKVNIQISKLKMNKRENPFLDSNTIFIPLSGGAVAKFNCNSDSIEWTNQEFKEQYVSYNSNSSYLYQHFGRGVNQICKLSGKTVNQLDFSKSLKEEFHSSGSIWCSDDYIITKDLQSGKFCVLGADNLEPLGLEFVMKKGFSESPLTFQIMKNNIYVLGMDNVLREYQIN